MSDSEQELQALKAIEDAEDTKQAADEEVASGDEIEAILTGASDAKNDDDNNNEDENAEQKEQGKVEFLDTDNDKVEFRFYPNKTVKKFVNGTFSRNISSLKYRSYDKSIWDQDGWGGKPADDIQGILAALKGYAEKNYFTLFIDDQRHQKRCTQHSDQELVLKSSTQLLAMNEVAVYECQVCKQEKEKVYGAFVCAKKDCSPMCIECYVSEPAVNCPGQHQLQQFSAPHEYFGCDGCHRSMPLQGTLYGCRECDFDLCSSCYSNKLITTCLKSHILTSVTKGELLKDHSAYMYGFSCNQCKNSYSADDVCYHCSVCNYDLCQLCYKRRVQREHRDSNEYDFDDMFDLSASDDDDVKSVSSWGDASEAQADNPTDDDVANKESEAEALVRKKGDKIAEKLQECPLNCICGGALKYERFVANKAIGEEIDEFAYLGRDREVWEHRVEDVFNLEFEFELSSGYGGDREPRIVLEIFRDGRSMTGVDGQQTMTGDDGVEHRMSVQRAQSVLPEDGHDPKSDAIRHYVLYGGEEGEDTHGGGGGGHGGALGERDWHKRRLTLHDVMVEEADNFELKAGDLLKVKVTDASALMRKFVVRKMTPICYSCGERVTHALVECDSTSDLRKYIKVREAQNARHIRHIQFCATCVLMILAASSEEEIDGKLVIQSQALRKFKRFIPPMKVIKFVSNDKSKDIKHVKDNALVLCMKHDDELKKQRRQVCYAKVDISHITVEERYEAGIAKCNLKLSVTFYWLFDARDYNEFWDKTKKIYQQQRVWNKVEKKRPWTPKIHFLEPVEATRQQKEEELQYNIKPIAHIYGPDSLRARAGPKTKKKSKAEYKALGYFRETSMDFELDIDEPFELESFPFDSQDIPFTISADNFGKLAPGISWCDRDREPVVRVRRSAANIGNWEVQKCHVEFESANTMTVRVKMSRVWRPIVIQYVFTIFCVTFLSMSTLIFEPEENQFKLEISTGLILTLIFIDIPTIPVFTMLHWYFYTSFLFLVLIAAQNAFSDIFPQYYIVFGYIFAGMFICYHLIFMMAAIYNVNKERKKLAMTSSEIRETVEKEALELRSLKSEQKIMQEMQHDSDKEFVLTKITAKPHTELDSFAALRQRRRDSMGCTEKVATFFAVLLFLVLLVFPLVVGVISVFLKKDKITCDQSINLLADTNKEFDAFNAAYLIMCGVTVIFALGTGINVWKTISDTWAMLGFAVIVCTESAIFLMSVYLFTIWNNSCRGSGAPLLIWWLLLLYMVSFVIAMAIPACIGLADYWSSYDRYEAILGVIVMVWLYVVQITCCIIQLDKLTLLNHHNADVDCLRDSNVSAVGTGEAWSMMILSLLQIYLFIPYCIEDFDEWRDEDEFGPLAGGCMCCFSLTQWGMCVHCAVFWASDLLCLSDVTQQAMFGGFMTWALYPVILMCYVCCGLLKDEL
eukprot:CAMPEP_0202689630 /NCGR_PEP_ID=MMETSP1385-20130828/4833_1 /ASSEMBLY_ACC=CAM_ASM_000861 /TAXON_ID=933848 /ORGANISM="Elphidium margaritaceum" /LENGTH=1426 /DNA_ID=CAMNT_0049344779 /DNA_START=82 /DNA_END=4362 /DNA_ORIENTATION=+